MRAFLFFTLLFLCAPAVSQIQNSEAQSLPFENALRGCNPGAENALYGWTASDAGTLDQETTNPLIGGASFKFDATAGSQTVESCAVDFSDTSGLRGLQGRPCRISCLYDYDGTTGDYTLALHDGSDNDQILVDADGDGDSDDLPQFSDTDGKPRTIEYGLLCPSSGTWNFQIASTTNGGGLNVDKCWIGEDYRRGSKSLTGPWTSYTPTTQGLGSETQTSMVYSVDGSSGYFQWDFTTGTVAASEIQIGLPNSWTVAGVADTELVGFCMDDAATTGSQEYTVLATNGDTYLNIGRNVSGTSQNPLTPGTGNVILNNTRRYSCQVGPVRIAELSANVDTVTLGTQNTDIFAIITGATSTSLGTSNASSAAVTASDLTLDDSRSKTGVEIACSAETSSGTTCTGDESYGISFSAPDSGRAEVCTGLYNYVDRAASGRITNNFRTQRTENDSNTVLDDIGFNRTVRFGASGDSGADGRWVHWCDRYDVNAGRNTFKLFNEITLASGTTNNNEIRTGARSTAVTFSVKFLTQNKPSIVALTGFKWQKNTLDGNETATNTDIDDLRLSNLEIGKTYRLTLSAYLESQGTSATEICFVDAVHDSADILRVMHRNDGQSDLSATAAGNSVIFTATATNVTFDFQENGTCVLTDDYTFSILEELPGYVETSQWFVFFIPAFFTRRRRFDWRDAA